MGWLGRSLGDFGNQVGEGRNIAQEYAQRAQQMKIAAADQALRQLMGPLQLQELQARIKQMQQPKPVEPDLATQIANVEKALGRSLTPEEKQQYVGLAPKMQMGKGEPLEGSSIGRPPGTWWTPVLDLQGNVTNYVQTGKPADLSRIDASANLENLRQQHRQELAKVNAGYREQYRKLTDHAKVNPQQWQALNHDPGWIDANKKLTASVGQLKQLDTILATGKDPLGGQLTPEAMKSIQQSAANAQQQADEAVASMTQIRNRVVFGQVAPASPGTFAVTAGGKTYTFPDQAHLDAFKKEAGIP